MASIRKGTYSLFFTTSPRTPSRMIPEIQLLASEYSGDSWNAETQASFMTLLAEQDFFLGSKPKDPAFSARDRINRAPKALGFVDLKPTIELTAAGEEYVLGDMSSEALLRQLLKFQIPSPYHTIPRGSSMRFWIRPYLEIIRLVRHFGTLSFDELKIFGMQLTDYREFDDVVRKIDAFRSEKALRRGEYKRFLEEVTEREIRVVYSENLATGDLATRESNSASVKKFIKTKTGNWRDYADACFRYLQATEIVSVSQVGHSLSIPKDRVADVDFILQHVPRDPVFVNEERSFKRYLFDASIPALLTDDRATLIRKIASHGEVQEYEGLTTGELKTLERRLRDEQRRERLNLAVRSIKNREQYEDIQRTFDGIVGNEYYDNPLMFEWNTWRAMTMIDGGDVMPNFKLDDAGQPLSTAAGNMPDILCDYGDFLVTVEVTLQRGQKQYDNESEPVARHVGRVKAERGKDTFCLFVAPKIHEAAIAHFFMLHKVTVAMYGGRATIIPVELSVYRKMLEDSYRSSYVPNRENIRRLFKASQELASSANDEQVWYTGIQQIATNWLSA